MSLNYESHANVTWLEEYKAVHIEWKQLYMSVEKFQEICTQALGILSEHKGSIWIANQYESYGVFNKEIQGLILGNLTLLAQQAGVEKILTVMPKQVGLSSLNTKRWVSGVTEQSDFTMGSFETLETCLSWLKNSEIK